MDCSLGLNIVKENLNHVLMSVRYRLQMCHIIQDGKSSLFVKYILLICEKSLCGSFCRTMKF